MVRPQFLPTTEFLAPGLPRGRCWSQTRADYLARVKAGLRAAGSLGTAGCLREAKEEHRQEVGWAAEEGLPVPAEVLAQYPALKRKAAK